MGVLDGILVTPSNHRVHHAQNERYIDKNYGGMLILWDRLFGTFEDERADEPVVFGVRKPLANWNPYRANLQVYKYLLFDARNTKNWKDKLSVWFRRTGWRPADVAARFPKKNMDLTKFEKFDPEVPQAVARYVLAQFVIVIAAILAMGALFATAGAGAVLVPCLMLWAQLYTLGLLNEGRGYATRFELLRLLVIVPAGAFALSLDERTELSPELIAITGGAYVLASLVALLVVRRVINTISNQLDINNS
jgi:sterol desaturase/sphingolipid hydroxylase (fatty acid hydroxylase superfamily)